MMKRIVLSFLLLALPLAARADQTLNAFNEYCNGTAPSVTLFAYWHNYAGQPSCTVSSTKMGTSCSGGIIDDLTVTVVTPVPHGICTCETTYKAANTITLHPGCGGTIITARFIVVDGTCDNF